MRLAGLTGFILGLMIFVSTAAQAQSCVAPRPVIQVKTLETPVTFDISKSVTELSAMEMTGTSPFPAHYHTEIGGVMSGEITVSHNMIFSHTQTDEARCVFLKQVTVTIEISPSIYIASDFQGRSCWFKEIFAHEAKHVAVERAVMNKYAGRFTDALNLILMEPADYTVPVASDKGFEQAQRELQTGMEHALGVMFNQMTRERNERQQAIDTLEEYQRIARICSTSS